MNKSDLLEFGVKNGFTQISKSVVVGVWDDYVTLLAESNGAIGVTFSATVKARDKKSLIKLNKLIAGYGLKVGGWNDKRVFVSISSSLLKDRQLREYLDTITRCMRDVNAYPQLVCAICGEMGCDVMAIHKGEYARAHKKCVEKEIKQIEIDFANEKIKNKGGHLQALPGAIIGAFLGAFINIVITAFTAKVYSIAFLFVPALAYITYKKWQGLIDIKGSLICGGVSVYLAYLMVCFDSAYSMWFNDSMGFIDAMNSMLIYLFAKQGFIDLTSKAIIYFEIIICVLFFAQKILQLKKDPKIKPEDIQKTMVEL